MSKYLALVLAIVAYSAIASETDNVLLSARSLKCQMGDGYAETITDKNPKGQVLPWSDKPDPFFFDSINLKKGSARLIGKAGASDITVIATPLGVTFVEIAKTILDFTTIFFAGQNEKQFLASDARYQLIAGQQTTEQYSGSCVLWQ